MAPYLARRFNLRDQNCWHLARDAWLELTGQDLGDRTPEQLTKAALLGRFDSDVPAFARLARPQDPCLVLFARGRDVPHVGVYTGGRVLQMTASGASYMPMAQARHGYSEVGYYVDQAADRH